MKMKVYGNTSGYTWNQGQVYEGTLIYLTKSIKGTTRALFHKKEGLSIFGKPLFSYPIFWILFIGSACSELSFLEMSISCNTLAAASSASAIQCRYWLVTFMLRIAYG